MKAPGLEAARVWAQERISDHTGLIHYYGEAKLGECHDTIPIVENVAYALTLLRQHTLEATQQAKQLLQRLLYFQNLLREDDRGSFPVYLHHYPYCYDRLIAARLLPLFGAILTDYGSLLGKDLEGQLLEGSQQLYLQAKAALTRRPGPALSALAIHAFGEGIVQQDLTPFWVSTAGLATFMQINGTTPQLLTVAQKEALLHHLGRSYSSALGCYIGPALDERQEGFEPQATPYDVYLAASAGNTPHRLSSPHHAHLFGPLIGQPPQEVPFATPLDRWEGTITDRRYLVCHQPSYAYSVLGGECTVNPGWHAFRMLWGTLNRVHSLVCQRFGGTLSWEETDSGIDLLFTYPHDLPPIDKGPVSELSLFTDRHRDLHILVNGQKATLFHLDDRLTVQSETFQFTIEFACVKGQGDFVGGLLFANRPAQVKKDEAYDNQLLIRTLRRSSSMALLVKIRI